jgi:DNA modification methylase
MIELLQSSDYAVACCDGAEGMLRLPDKSIKLIYGSPPYPNAERDYGVWKSSEYIDKMTPFLNAAVLKLRDDGFIVINVKANREKSTSKASSKRSLVVEKLAILMEEEWGLSCVDIEIWVKENPVPTGLRVACQDAYEQNLWFSKSPKWTINLDAIRRPYESHSIKTYEEYEYKPRSNGLTYVRKNKRIKPHPIGALPRNVISGGVSAKIGEHQATQPIYLPDKYIKATTEEGDLVVDPWMGSGTTGFAALSLKRKFIGFDIVDSYVKTAENCFKEFIQGMVIGNEQKSSQT